MSKRPSLGSIGLDLDDIEAKPASGQKVPAFHEQPPAPEVDGKHVKDKAVNMTVYLMPADHKRLKMMAVSQDTTIQALVMDGLDILLERDGQEPLTRWKPRKKPRS
ncbi:ribbon-helix-helix domain-containing protein [Gluconobacter oxydans]|uniref:ribbon-helix-helix domain-containing protein n=1 Tax=Gluconobacter oxydans TaxID=442 RepID=UPI0015595868|nr:ribbon-helix-helix domain-containing protein [Gluconobacter oxydans]